MFLIQQTCIKFIIINLTSVHYCVKSQFIQHVNYKFEKSINFYAKTHMCTTWRRKYSLSLPILDFGKKNATKSV